MTGSGFCDPYGKRPKYVRLLQSDANGARECITLYMAKTKIVDYDQKEQEE